MTRTATAAALALAIVACGGEDDERPLLERACDAYCHKLAGCDADASPVGLCLESCYSDGIAVDARHGDACTDAQLEVYICRAEGLACSEWLGSIGYLAVCPEVAEGLDYCPPLGIGEP